MSDPVLWVPGIDVSLLPDVTSDCGTFKGLTPTMLGQLVSKMTLTGGHRLLVWSESEPDVVTYPVYKQFIWVVPSTLVAKAYDDGTDTWELWPTIPANSLDGSVLLDNSIPITKLLSAGGDAGKVIYRTATGLVYALPQDTFTVGSLALQALSWPTSPVGAFLKLTGSGYGFEVLDRANILNRIGLLGIPSTYIKVVGGVDNKILGTNNDGQIILVDPPSGSGLAVPVPDPADEGKVLTAADDGTATWEAPAAPPTTVENARGGPFTVPTVAGTNGVVNSGGRVEFTHGHASIPDHVSVWLQNVTPQHGWLAGERLPYNMVQTADADPIFEVKVTATKVIVFGTRYIASPKIVGYDATANEEETFTPGNWRVYIATTL